MTAREQDVARIAAEAAVEAVARAITIEFIEATNHHPVKGLRAKLLEWLAPKLARAAIAAYEATLRPAIEAEIVAWLRERDEYVWNISSLADAIERGEHRAILRPVTPE